jgi:hypothetical protein
MQPVTADPTATASPGDTGLPLDFFPNRSKVLPPEQIERWITMLLVLGIAARIVRYALRFPLWGDEAFLSASFLHRGYLDLLRPLEYHQVCPLLFLWGQLTIVKLLGFTEFTLRLFSLLCSIASLFVFRSLARRVVRGTSLLVAVGIFAVAYPGIRYAAEAKPYQCDLLVSLVLLLLCIQWWRRPQHVGWLWGLAVAMPIAIGLSYPSVFVAGGIVVAVAVMLWTLPLHRGWPAWGTLTALLGLSFLTMLKLSTGSQLQADLGEMQSYWHESFPPLHSLTALLRWLVSAHSGELLAYPIGGPHGGSAATLFFCAVAVLMLWRKRQSRLLLLLLTPLALNFVAALVHRYPYGMAVRLALYWAPMACLLSGMGVDVVLARLWPHRRRLPETAIVFALALLAVGSICRDVAYPGKSDSDIRARDFARWFWFEMARDGELVCCKTDLGRDFSPQAFQLGQSAVYLCNQRIYSPRHAQCRPPQMDRVSTTWPLRCVQYCSSQYPRDEVALAGWLTAMQAHYHLLERHVYPTSHIVGRDQYLGGIDLVELFVFTPEKQGGTGKAEGGAGKAE